MPNPGISTAVKDTLLKSGPEMAPVRRALLEREAEIATLERKLLDARSGRGNVVAIEAAAGMGKSCLIDLAADTARVHDLLVFRAQGSELEREFPFGVAIQLFERGWLTRTDEERAKLTEGPGRWANELLMGGLAAPTSFSVDHGYAVIRGLYWLIVNLSTSAPDATPLAILVDDAHLADQMSLRFLAYLAERIESLPVSLIIALRPAEGVDNREALIPLRASAESVRPASLSAESVRQLVREMFPDAEEDFCGACVRVTGGNPFLLVELLDQVQSSGQPPSGETGARLADLTPEAVLDAVIARLGSMATAANRVASAVAVLGDGAPLQQVARLSELDASEASTAAASLAATHFLCDGEPLSFLHPLVGAAVHAAMSPLERGRAHGRAARILADDGAPEASVAAHLLEAPPQSEPEWVRILCAAADRASASGAFDSACVLLRRALEEPPPPDAREGVLAALAEAEAAAGSPNAAATLEQAIATARDPHRRGRLLLVKGMALYEEGAYGESAAVLGAAIEGLGSTDSSLRRELQAAQIAAASLEPTLAEQTRAQASNVLSQTAESPTAPDRNALAHVAVHASVRGDDRRSVRNLVDVAWGNGVLVQSSALDPSVALPLVTGALLFTDDLERALDICGGAAGLADGEEQSNIQSVARYCRMWPLYEQGRINDAIEGAQAAIDARPRGWRTYVRTGYSALACCHLMRGELDRAETALSIIEHPEMRDVGHLPFLLDTRAKLRLIQRRPAEALADAVRAGRLWRTRFGVDTPGAVAWRSTAAFAHLALDEPSQALELANEELAQARQIGATRIVIRDLRAIARAERGRRGIELLSEAVETGEGYGPRLEHVQAKLDLGAALRRANRRVDAQKTLREALTVSRRHGAHALVEEANTELAATGARSRRVMRFGLEALTASERRVADLAADGLTTRQMANTLFVTPKTIEFHLRHIYQKLSIGSRAEIAVALRAGDGS